MFLAPSSRSLSRSFEEVQGPVQLASKKRGWLCSGYGQLVVASYASFANVGVWNALNTIGGLGTGNVTISHISMTILHGCSLMAGFCAGSAVNYYGLRTAAFVGSFALSQFLFTVFAVYYKNMSYGLLVGAALVCGSLVGWLQAAIGSVCIRYSTDSQRAVFLAISSVVLNLGGVLGSAFSLGMNISEHPTLSPDGQPPAIEEGGGLSKLNYIILLAVLFSGMPVSLLLQPPHKVVRSDNTIAPPVPHSSMGQELRGTIAGLKEPFLWLMFPIFMCSIWHEVTLFNFFNVQLFDVRSRAMNAVFYYAGRILVSFPFQIVTDWPRNLPNQILAGNVFVLALCAAAFCTAILTLANAFNVRHSTLPLDFTEPRSSFLEICFFFYGALETVATSFSLWLIGSLPFDDPAMSNRYVGWFRVGASVGAFSSWLINSVTNLSNDIQWAISALLWCIAMICIAVLQLKLRKRIRDEDLSLQHSTSKIYIQPPELAEGVVSIELASRDYSDLSHQ